jgi:tRNA threonylcarbamoyladenosine biosynthesis protein TsaB
MAIILHIDTAGNDASVFIAANKSVISNASSNQLNEHASFLHPAIQDVLKNASIDLQNIDAVAVANGPGSYTGLRVGLAAGKGICYALKKPLICINSLEILAAATRAVESGASVMHAPMIDARRMEVFTALYDHQGKSIISPHAEVLNESSFAAPLQAQKILFAGTGMEKWKKICHHPNALFSTEYNLIAAFASLANDSFMIKQFADIAYAEPFYSKEFHFGN